MSEPSQSIRRLDLPLSGMTCAACAARIEKVLNRLPGVDASVNFASERARIALSGGQTSPQELVASIAKAGFCRAAANGRTVDRRHDLRFLFSAH